MSLLVSAFSSSTAGACLEPFQQTLNRVSSTHWTSHWAVQLSTLSWRGTVHASLQNVLNLKYICTGSTFISAAAAWSLCKITNNMSASPCRPRWVSLWNIVFLLLLSLPLMCGWYNTLMFLHLLKSPPGGGWELVQEKNYVATFTFILTLQVKTFDLGTGNTTFTIRYVFTTQSSLLLV